jgi:hypothetical protein
MRSMVVGAFEFSLKSEVTRKMPRAASTALSGGSPPPLRYRFAGEDRQSAA